MAKTASKKRTAAALKPTHQIKAKGDKLGVEVYVGDCRELLPKIPVCNAAADGGRGGVDLVFADPPFNWARAYDEWDDKMAEAEYLQFTYDWLDLCEKALSPIGSMWVNIPDDWAAEIVVHLKGRGLKMINWCVWHYRFGQNTTSRFINSKVHALYFARHERVLMTKEDRDRALAGGGGGRIFNSDQVLEVSDRRAIYFDKRTEEKRDGVAAGHRLPMDVWYGKHWGRIQGNNKERRHYHDNQLPELYLERVIRACSDEGDTVMDPFLGSGTTGVVAHELGRRFIGTEYSKANAKSAFERIKAGPLRVKREAPTAAASTAIFGPRRVKPRERVEA